MPLRALKTSLFAFCACLGACASAPQPDRFGAPSAARIMADTAWLADDARQGREAGSAGYDAAAAYVADAMAAAGVKPGYAGEWLQRVPMRAAVRKLDGYSFTLSEGGASSPLVHLVDYIGSTPIEETAAAARGEIVFAGFGVVAPKRAHDDYQGLDVRGKIVAVFSGAPASFNTEERAHFGSSSVKGRVAADRGAIAIVTIPTRESITRNPWARIVEKPMAQSMTWVGPDGAAHVSAPEIDLFAFLSEAGARKLFAGEARAIDDLWAEVAGGETPAGFALRKSAALTAASTHSVLSSANVIGVIEGADPRLRNEAIIVSAHLDHIGVGGAPEAADKINNGALDNAIGVAMLIETARAVRESGDRPKRSIIFAALTAEEKGLIGADYLARQPAPGFDFVGNVNIDMPLVLFPFTDVVAFGGERSTLGDHAKSAARGMGLALSPDPLPQEGLFTRSDHYRFVEQGVPAIYIAVGFASGGEAAFEGFLKEHYHRPSDDLTRPINPAAAARFAELNYRILMTAANARERPKWRRGDFFGDLFAKP